MVKDDVMPSADGRGRGQQVLSILEARESFRCSRFCFQALSIVLPAHPGVI